MFARLYRGDVARYALLAPPPPTSDTAAAELRAAMLRAYTGAALLCRASPATAPRSAPGHCHNQLSLCALLSGCEFLALYHAMRAAKAGEPFGNGEGVGRLWAAVKEGVEGWEKGQRRVAMAAAAGAADGGGTVLGLKLLLAPLTETGGGGGGGGGILALCSQRVAAMIAKWQTLIGAGLAATAAARGGGWGSRFNGQAVLTAAMVETRFLCKMAWGLQWRAGTHGARARCSPQWLLRLVLLSICGVEEERRGGDSRGGSKGGEGGGSSSGSEKIEAGGGGVRPAHAYA